MKNYLSIIIAVIALTAMHFDVNSQPNSTENQRSNFGKRRYHLHLIKKPYLKPGTWFRIRSVDNGIVDSSDLAQLLNKESGFISITNQLNNQNARVDLTNGNIILDGLEGNGAIIEYPIIAKNKNGAEFKSVIVFLDSLGGIEAAFKDQDKGYIQQASNEKLAVCGLWSSWSTVSFRNCKLHPNCPRNVYGAKLANQIRTRKCTNGKTETEYRTVFVGCNCYT